MAIWRVAGPAFERQQAFNAALVDHLNRNVAAHRANRQSIEATIGAMRGELEKLETFHTTLVLYLQTITRFVDTKDRSEHIATLANLTNAGLAGVADEFRRRWESMVAREQRYVAAVDELRTSIASVQQTGLMLKRELERGLAAGAAPAASAGGAGGTSAAVPAAEPPRPAAPAIDAVNAYKYVAFENKFRGSEADIRARLLQYVELFDGADNVLDLGCGRGEFLALLRERGIRAHGLDINHEMIEACRAAGLEALEGDALAYLESLPDASLGGLIAVQVVEHFQPAYLTTFLDVAYHKLKPGATHRARNAQPLVLVRVLRGLHPRHHARVAAAPGDAEVPGRRLRLPARRRAVAVAVPERREAAARRAAGRRPDGQPGGHRAGLQRKRRQGQRGDVLVSGLCGRRTASVNRDSWWDQVVSSQ